jgi:hypothetical protein
MPTTYEKIATTTLSSTNTVITLSSIPSTYTDLRIVAMLKVTNPGTVVEEWFRVNNDSATNYSVTRITGDGSSATSVRETNQAQIPIKSGAASGNFLMTKIDIFSYAGSTNKTMLIDITADSNTNNTSSVVQQQVGLWRSTSAINRIDFVGAGDTFAIGSSVTLYGILKA